MNPYLESLIALVLAALGFLLGRRFARLPKHWWILGFILPFAVVLLYVSCVRYPSLILHPAVSWLCLGRSKYALFGVVASMLLSTPMHRLPRARDRRAVGSLVVVMAGYLGVVPYLAPVFNQARLAQLKTRIDSDGVCLQGTSYTCGPAAAVTVLRHLGISAGEGEIARWARTTFTTGTPPEVLAATLQHHYGPAGVTARFQICNHLGELQTALPALVVTKFDFFQDHFVALVSLSENEVTVADPLMGLVKYSPAEFSALWRRTAVIIQRSPK